MNPEFIRALMNTDPAAAAEEIKLYIEKENNVPINIAITGECGSGKSTFVNSFRGMSNDDEKAAPTGCVETTLDNTSYPHPNYSNVVLWDLPGVGTTKFPADEYLKHVGFEKFDIFIIISATRFTENDVKLAKAIQKMEKKFYFVRSKIDDDLRAEERSKKKFNEEETKKKIKENCIQGLQNAGLESPQVFLLSSFDLHLHEFPLLHEIFDKEVPEHKRHALLMAMPNINLEVINKKKEALKAKIKYYATASAAVAAVTVPGLSIAVDSGLMATAVKHYVHSFRLDISSLKNLAKTTGVPFTDLIEVIKSPLAAVEITPPLIINYLSQLSIAVAFAAGEEGSRLIPLFGIPLAMGFSFAGTYQALNFILSVLAENAERVFKRALGLNSSV